MAVLLPAAPFLAYFGLLALVVVLAGAAFWPVVLPRLITFLTGLRDAAEARRRQRSARLARRLER